MLLKIKMAETQTRPRSSATQRVVRYGLREVSVNPLVQQSEGILHLTERQQHELRCPPYSLRVKWQGDAVRLGPSIAIYALSFSGKSLFGPQTGMFVDLAMLCRAQGVDLFVATPGQLRYAQKEVIGYRYDSQMSTWHRQACPWPDFVWRRVTNRPTDLVGDLDRDEVLLTGTTQLATLPRTQSEKWHIHTLLQSSPESAPYILPTYLAKRPEDIVQFVRLLGDAYVKPVRGTQGQQVVRVIARGLQFVEQSTNKNEQNKKYITDKEIVGRWSNRLLPDHYFLVQRTVAVMKTATGQPFDLRYLIQAKKGGSCVCSAVIAKVGARTAVTTNLHTGGHVMAVLELENRLKHSDRTLFQKGLQSGEEAALAAFAKLAQAHPTLAEVGVDIAIDRRGQVFILEVNPCPGRRMLRIVSPKIRHLSLVRVIEYAVFSTGFESE